MVFEGQSFISPSESFISTVFPRFFAAPGISPPSFLRRSKSVWIEYYAAPRYYAAPIFNKKPPPSQKKGLLTVYKCNLWYSLSRVVTSQFTSQIYQGNIIGCQLQQWADVKFSLALQPLCMHGNCSHRPNARVNIAQYNHQFWRSVPHWL